MHISRYSFQCEMTIDARNLQQEGSVFRNVDIALAMHNSRKESGLHC